MATFISELFSIIIGILSKTAFIAFPILFMSSLLLKMNWVHHSSFMITMFLLLINVTMAYGWVYIFFYIFARGLSGHYVPKGLPPFPYFMTTPQVQHINYLKEVNGIKQLPKNMSSAEEYSQTNFDGNIAIKMFRWVFPKSEVKWQDRYLLSQLDNPKITFEIEKNDDCGSYLRYYDLDVPGAK